MSVPECKAVVLVLRRAQIYSNVIWATLPDSRAMKTKTFSPCFSSPAAQILCSTLGSAFKLLGRCAQHPAGNLTGVIGAAHGAQLQSIFPLHSLPLQQSNLVHHSAQTYMYYLFILKSIIVKSNPVFALRRWVCWKQWCLLPEPPPAQREHSSGRRTGGSPWVPPGFRATLLISFALTWFYSSHFSPAPQGNSVKFTKCNS